MRAKVLILAISLLPSLANACMMKPEEKASLFRMFDSDKDGFISRDEYIAGESRRVGRDHTDKERAGFSERYNKMDAKGTNMVNKQLFEPVSLQKCM